MNNVPKPTLNPTFFYGPIISYQFHGDITKDKGKYRIRFTLIFKSGDAYTTQKGGFETYAEASKAKDVLIASIVRNEYIPFEYTVKEYFDYWLYYCMVEEKKVRYSTFQVYRNNLYNHLLPALGEKKKLNTISINDLTKAFRAIPHASVKAQCAKIAKLLFGDAYQKHFISFDPSIAAEQNVKKDFPSPQKRDISAFSVESIRQMLFICKQNFREMYIPLLLSLTLGTRISETIGLMYSDIDFTSNTIYISRQLGRDINDESGEGLTTKPLAPKTDNGIRSIPCPQWVSDELIVQKAWYEEQKRIVPNFRDTGYICCRCNGLPFNRKRFHSDFKQLLAICGLPQIRWHDLRHIYASTLKNNAVNMKAVSTFLGHYSADFTEDVYVHQKDVAYDCSMLEDMWEACRPIDSLKQSKEPVELPISDEDYDFWLQADS